MGSNNTPFRFLDLAPELRNRIYDFALYHNRSQGIVAAAGLLATCKEINDGAKELLYIDSTFSMTIKTRRIKPATEHMKLEAFEITGDLEHTQHTEPVLATLYHLWPKALFKCPDVHITFDPDYRKSDRFFAPPGCIVLQYILYSLFARLDAEQQQQSAATKSLHIHFVEPTVTEQEERLFWTWQNLTLDVLVSLPHHIRVYLSGVHPKAEARFLDGGKLSDLPEGQNPKSVDRTVALQYNATTEFFRIEPLFLRTLENVRANLPFSREAQQAEVMDRSSRDTRMFFNRLGAYCIYVQTIETLMEDLRVMEAYADAVERLNDSVMEN